VLWELEVSRNIWVYATDSYFQDTSTCLAKAGGAGVSAGSSSNGTGGTYTAGSVGDITHNEVMELVAQVVTVEEVEGLLAQALMVICLW